MLFRLTTIFFTLLLILSCNEEQISYSNDIKPILNSRCIACHGGVKKHGGLSLLTKEETLSRSSKTGIPALIPGNASKSEIYKRILSNDPDYAMPRDHDPIPHGEREKIKKWIDQGAKWDTHWSYLPVENPTIPDVKDQWAATNIDKYIFQKLDLLGLSPNREIEKNKLVRRASQDATGLPPKEKLANQYLNNEIGYDKYLDQLISSSSYGEHWSAMWLDLARYADSKGYEKDPHRNIWRYRDWVINALNDDIPFDQFTIDQLAGDLLDSFDEEKLIATAFHRNSMTNTEGGTDDEEFRVAAVMDRLNTTFEIWQGTTIACAQCHDHPYDPISQKEFFESMSFFNNTIDADLAGEFPVIETFTTKSKEEINDIVAFISKVEDKQINKSLPTVEKIKKAIYPKLLPRDCDDFYNMLIFPDGIMSNWTNNVNDMKDRQFYFMYKNIDFDHLIGIEATYATSGEKALIKVSLDSINGHQLHQSGFQKTKSVSGHEWSGRHEWKKLLMPISSSINGKHDIIFEITNPSLEVPEGIVLFKEFELKFDNFQENSVSQKKKEDLIALRDKAEKTPIVKEKSWKLLRPNQIHVRGNQRTRGDTVIPNVPKIFNLNNVGIKNRLELAQWLTDKSNPLTARVIVNRVWAYIFGQGIVSTLEDFGSQGEVPTHPELLDYLAYSLVHTHKWSIKKLIKEILTSNVYCQSSKASKQKLDIDPYNKYYSRGPRFRLTAEQIRDQALAISELLFDSIGGPSVMPPQPKGVWQTVYNNNQWITSEGNHKYRRGIYTYWKRSSPYPSMEAFDSPTREVCRSERITTNTPNQALVTLNDPVYIEAANQLGKLMNDYSEKVDKRIEYAYRKSLNSEIDNLTKSVLIDLYEKADSKLFEYINSSEAHLQSPSAVIAHTIFNLDAFLNKS